MKYTITLCFCLIAVILSVSAQDVKTSKFIPKEITTTETQTKETKDECTDLIEVKTDKFSGETSVSGKGFLKVSNSGSPLQIIIAIVGKEKNAVVTAFYPKMSGCVDENGKIYFLFKDGTRTTVAGNQDFNCDGKFVIYYGDLFGNASLLNDLKTKQIDAIRFSGRKDIEDVDFSKEEADKVKATLNCLSTYLK